MRKTVFPSAAPFAAMLALTTRTAEMLLASGHVIGYRTGRMLAGGPTPGAADRREFERMGSEKVAAAGAASQAMIAHLVESNFRFARLMFNAQVGIAGAAAALLSSRTPAQARSRHSTLVSKVMRSPVATAQLSRAATRLAQKGLAPVHARAVANSKRLAKR